MKEFDENEILKRFRAISEFKTPPEAVADDLKRTKEAITNKLNESQKKNPNKWRIIMKSKTTKFAAAAVIIIAVIIFIYSSNGSVDITTSALASDLAQVQENIQKAPWMYMGRRTSQGVMETWFAFEAGILAARNPSGLLFLNNHQEQKMYQYDPDTHVIEVFPFARAEVPEGPLEFVNQIIKAAEDEGGQITRKKAKHSGKDIDIYIIEIKVPDREELLNRNEFIKASFKVDIQSRLLIGLEVETTDVKGQINESASYTSSIEYPEKGPQTIYDLGAPKSAKIVEIKASDKN